TTAPYTASWDTTAVADGLYDLRVVTTDLAGNSAASAVVTSREVDNTAPDTAIDAHPANPSNATSPVFLFSSSETGSTFECRVDGGSWSSCSSPDTIAPALGEGSHTFDVRATDPAGNTDASPASDTWTVDTTAPDTSITAHPADPSSNTAPSFSFASTETGSTFECRVDGGSWAPCTNPHSLSGLTDGPHTFAVRATDAAGNTDASPATYTWTVDTAAPDTSITSAPTNPSNDTAPSFSFTSPESGSTFECRVDGGSWPRCPTRPPL